MVEIDFQKENLEFFEDFSLKAKFISEDYGLLQSKLRGKEEVVFSYLREVENLKREINKLKDQMIELSKENIEKGRPVLGRKRSYVTISPVGNLDTSGDAFSSKGNKNTIDISVNDKIISTNHHPQKQYMYYDDILNDAGLTNLIIKQHKEYNKNHVRPKNFIMKQVKLDIQNKLRENVISKYEKKLDLLSEKFRKYHKKYRVATKALSKLNKEKHKLQNTYKKGNKRHERDKDLEIKEKEKERERYYEKRENIRDQITQEKKNYKEIKDVLFIDIKILKQKNIELRKEGKEKDRIINNYKKMMRSRVHEYPKDGLITFVFSDIEESTALWRKDFDVMTESLIIHNRVMREAIADYNGYEVKTEGDSFLVSFDSPIDACNFCLKAQLSLLKCKWPDKLSSFDETSELTYETAEGKNIVIWKGLRIRMGIHCAPANSKNANERLNITVDPVTQRADYFGPPVNICSRVMGKASGGEIMISDQVYEKIKNSLSELDTDIIVKDRGSHQLKGYQQLFDVFSISPVLLGKRNFSYDEESIKKAIETMNQKKMGLNGKAHKKRNKKRAKRINEVLEANSKKGNKCDSSIIKKRMLYNECVKEKASLLKNLTNLLFSKLENKYRSTSKEFGKEKKRIYAEFNDLFLVTKYLNDSVKSLGSGGKTQIKAIKANLRITKKENQEFEKGKKTKKNKTPPSPSEKRSKFSEIKNKRVLEVRKRKRSHTTVSKKKNELKYKRKYSENDSSEEGSKTPSPIQTNRRQRFEGYEEDKFIKNESPASERVPTLMFESDSQKKLDQMKKRKKRLRKVSNLQLVYPNSDYSSDGSDVSQDSDYGEKLVLPPIDSRNNGFGNTLSLPKVNGTRNRPPNRIEEIRNNNLVLKSYQSRSF